MVPFCFLFYSKLGPGTLGFLRLGSQFYSCNHCFSSPPSSSCARLCVRVRQDKYVLQDWVFSIEAANTPVWTPRGEVCQRASRSGFGGSTDVHPKPAQFWPACRHGLKAGGVEAAQRRQEREGGGEEGLWGGCWRREDSHYPAPTHRTALQKPHRSGSAFGGGLRGERGQENSDAGAENRHIHPSIHPEERAQRRRRGRPRSRRARIPEPLLSAEGKRTHHHDHWWVFRSALICWDHFIPRSIITSEIIHIPTFPIDNVLITFSDLSTPFLEAPAQLELPETVPFELQVTGSHWGAAAFWVVRNLRRFFLRDLAANGNPFSHLLDKRVPLLLHAARARTHAHTFPPRNQTDTQGGIREIHGAPAAVCASKTCPSHWSDQRASFIPPRHKENPPLLACKIVWKTLCQIMQGAAIGREPGPGRTPLLLLCARWSPCSPCLTFSFIWAPDSLPTAHNNIAFYGYEQHW